MVSRISDCCLQVPKSMRQNTSVKVCGENKSAFWKKDFASFWEGVSLIFKYLQMNPNRV